MDEQEKLTAIGKNKDDSMRFYGNFSGDDGQPYIAISLAKNNHEKIYKTRLYYEYDDGDFKNFRFYLEKDKPISLKEFSLI